MENQSRHEKRRIRFVRAGVCVLITVLAVWCVKSLRNRAGRTVALFSQWEVWPYPLSLTEELDAVPSVTNVVRRGSAEEFFFDGFKRVMVETDEVATEMVYVFHAQAECGGVNDIWTPANEACERLATIRKEFAKQVCPKVCKPVRNAAIDFLETAARFYRLSVADRAGFNVRALKRARIKYTEMEAALAEFTVMPRVPASELALISTNDCVALARVANDWDRAIRPKESAKKSDGVPEYPESMVPEQTFEEAYATDDYLKGLWLVLNGKGYSPFLASAFLCWRSQMQLGFFGMSNGSQIPNRQYNTVRYRALDRVMAYLRDHPNDEHAQAQKVVLSEVPNIQRGGMFGNTCPLYGRKDREF